MEEILNFIIEAAELENCHHTVKNLKALKSIAIEQELLIAKQRELIKVKELLNTELKQQIRSNTR